LRNDLFDAISRATDSGMLCTVASNGTLLTRDAAERLAAAGVKRVEIGLDGARAETHDFLRDRRGSFESAVQGIKNCSALGFNEVAVTMTLHSGNIGEVEKTMALAEGLGATRFYLNRLIPAGRGKEAIRMDVNAEEKKGALEALYSKFYDGVTVGGMQCYARGMTYYSRLGFERSGGRVFSVSESLSGHENMFKDKFGTKVADIVRALGTEFGGCSVGLTYAGLTASGDLIPCVPAPIRLGNLLEERLEDIWVNSDLLNYVRKRRGLKGACGGCAYKSVCGGCRYTAFALTGDWLGTDPSCPYGPVHVE
jgi:radical SAM protein with 4Fe4S-binding SPASM domain